MNFKRSILNSISWLVTFIFLRQVILFSEGQEKIPPLLMGFAFIPAVVCIYKIFARFGQRIQNQFHIFNDEIDEVISSHIRFILGFVVFSLILIFLGVLQIFHKELVTAVFFIMSMLGVDEKNKNHFLAKKWVAVLAFLGLFLSFLRGILPIGSDNWGDIHRYYGFFTKYFSQNENYHGLIDFLPSYIVFPMQSGFINGAMSILINEKFTAVFNSSLTVFFLFVLLRQISNTTKNNLMASSLVISSFLLVNPFYYDTNPTHFRSHEIFWIWNAAFFLNQFITNRKINNFYMFCLGLSMAFASMYGSLLHLPMLLIFFLIVIYNHEKNRIKILYNTALILFLGSVWYWMSWKLSGSPLAFTNFKIDLINEDFLSNDFMWRIASRELANQISGIQWLDLLKIMLGIFTKLFPMAFIGLGLAAILIFRKDWKGLRIAVIQLMFFFCYLTIAFLLVLKTDTNALGNKRHFYASLPFLFFAISNFIILALPYLNAQKQKLVSIICFSVLFIPSAENEFIKEHLNLQKKYWFGAIDTNEYVESDYKDLKIAVNLIQKNVPPGEAVLSHWGDLMYLANRNVYAIPMSKIGGDFWKFTDKQVKDHFDKKNIKWFLLNTNWFSQPYSDETHATLIDLLNPSLNLHILSGMKRVDEAQLINSTIVLYKIDPSNVKVDSLIKAYIISQEMLLGSRLSSIQSYRNAASILNAAPFAKEYRIYPEIAKISDKEFLISSSTCTIQYIFIPLSFSKEFIFSSNDNFEIYADNQFFEKVSPQDKGFVYSGHLNSKKVKIKFNFQSTLWSFPSMQLRAFNISDQCAK